MTISLVQYKVFQGAGTTAQVTFDSNVTAGNLLICATSIYHNNTPYTITITDNRGNTWVETSDNNYSVQDTGGLAYAQNAAGGATTITVTPNSNTGGWCTVVVAEVTGVETTAFDQSNQNAATSTSWTSNNITTTQAEEFVVGAFAHDTANRTLTPAAGVWTQIFEEETQSADMPINVSYRLPTATETIAFTGTISGAALPYWAAIASFKGIAASGGTAVPAMMHSYRLKRV